MNYIFKEKIPPFVSVIIPTYHDWNRLALCIEALKLQTYPKENYEVIIVNNDPLDIPPDISIPPYWKLITEDKPGSYAARNAAIRVSKGDVLAFTDSDCIPYPNWIEASVNLLESDSDISRVAGRVELFYKNDKLSPAEIYEKTFAFPQESYASKGFAATANMITYRSVIDKVGLFNINLMSGGDNEWGLRAHIQGFTIIYGKDCVVKHPSRNKISELTSKIRRISYGSLVLEKTSGKKSFWLIIGLLPPIFGALKVAEKKDLSIREKIIALFILYFLNIIRTWYQLLTSIGIYKQFRH